VLAEAGRRDHYPGEVPAAGVSGEKRIATDPDELVQRAETEQLGYREFLDLLLESEVGVLEGRRYQSRLKRAARSAAAPCAA
jgi:hypothetical protein